MGCVSLQIMQQTCEKQDAGMRWKLEARHTLERYLSDAGTESKIIRRQQATETSRRARFFKILHDGERLRQLAAIDEQSGDLEAGSVKWRERAVNFSVGGMCSVQVFED